MANAASGATARADGLHQLFSQHRYGRRPVTSIRRDQRGGGADVIGVVADSVARLVRFADDPFQFVDRCCDQRAGAVAADVGRAQARVDRIHGVRDARTRSPVAPRGCRSGRRRPAASRSSLDSAAASRNSSSQAARCAGAASPVCCASASVSAAPRRVADRVAIGRGKLTQQEHQRRSDQAARVRMPSSANAAIDSTSAARAIVASRQL